MRKINKIIIHYSDSDNPKHDNISVIRKWHLDREMSDVGYHYFIQSDGNIQCGRNIDTIGAHCIGENMHSIGICLHGRDNFTQNQFKSLKLLIESIKKEVNPDITIHGHCEFSKKTCPNFDYESVLNLK